jgi:segregation and condensation protein B
MAELPPTAEPPLPAIIEALLFVAEEPPTVAALARAVGAGEAAIRRALDALTRDCGGRGLRVQEHDGRYQLITAPELAPYVEAFTGSTRPRLSRAALETLSVIAYRQPCSRAEIEAIRGVNSDRVVAMLEQRGLVVVTGTSDGPGKPRLYAPAREFYEFFGLSGPGDLPPLPPGPEAHLREVAV